MGRIARWVSVYICVLMWKTLHIFSQVVFWNSSNTVHPFTNLLTHSLTSSITFLFSAPLFRYAIFCLCRGPVGWSWRVTLMGRWVRKTMTPASPLAVCPLIPLSLVSCQSPPKPYWPSGLEEYIEYVIWISASLQISLTTSLHLYLDMEGMASTRWAYLHRTSQGASWN